MTAFHERAVYVPISAEEHRLRTEGPTDVELARWKREAEERRAALQALKLRYASLRMAATGVLRKVMDLHQPEGESASWYTCGTCLDSGACGAEPLEWPCATAQVVLDGSP